MTESPVATVPAADDLIGAWRLARYVVRPEDGPEAPRWPAGALGLLHYGADGRMNAHLSAARAGDADLPAEQLPAYVGYAGPWTLVAGEVRHEVEIASIPSWIGRTLTREARLLPDGTLRLTASGTHSSGLRGTAVLDWRRLPA
ncbi:MAG: lipocalin-like domain-containing protein [Pseudomonadota bacterium]